MAIESSFIPFPSELVVPPAAYKALQPGSGLNIALIVFFATLGALIGAYINYYLAKILGRPIIYKFADSRLGHFLLLDVEKVEKAHVENLHFTPIAKRPRTKSSQHHTHHADHNGRQ